MDYPDCEVYQDHQVQLDRQERTETRVILVHRVKKVSKGIRANQ